MLSGKDAPDRTELTRFYREHLERHLLPFWRRAADTEHGGVFTCFSNDGSVLTGTDKYTWSQGRFLWLWSRMAELCRSGLLHGNDQEYLEQARRTCDFLSRHALLPDGSTSFLLSREGEPKESIPGLGYHVSFYADCFVVLGFAEYARVSGEAAVLDQAFRLYGDIERRLRERKVRSEPYPIPDAYDAHGFSMIMLNVSQELAGAMERLGDGRFADVRKRSEFYVGEIMTRFCDSRHLIHELVPRFEGMNDETLLTRHLNPGHSIECMWFVIHEAVRMQREDLMRKAVQVIERSFDWGWDREYGGILRYIDKDGGPPKGAPDDSGFGRLVRDTWDMKLWWPHSEALYALLLGYELTGEIALWDKYRMLHEYVFRTFPNPDGKVGEWIQIRHRQGRPMDTVVALPVKDPYHIARNVLLTIELLHK